MLDGLPALRCELGEVHVWDIQLDCPRHTLIRLRAILSADERERAAGFQLAEVSGRWTVARAAVRSILARYVGSAPQSLLFRIGTYGKPELAGAERNICFNLSRTRGLALLAITDTRRIGIDAETVHPDIDIEGISRRFFARGEVDEIAALAPDAQLTAFFACWTRKEAFIKAIGIGLSFPLHSFRVTVRPDQPARLISIAGDEPNKWTLVDLAQPGVAAALALEGEAPVLRRFNLCPQLIP
jgi:4'-phosphopantetheinyl transferase